MPHRWVWYSIVMLLASILVVSIAGVSYTNHVQQQADRRWCELLGTLNDANQHRPPTSDPRIVAYRQQIAQLHHDFGCKA